MSEEYGCGQFHVTPEFFSEFRRKQIPQGTVVFMLAEDVKIISAFLRNIRGKCKDFDNEIDRMDRMVISILRKNG